MKIITRLSSIQNSEKVNKRNNKNSHENLRKMPKIIFPVNWMFL